MSKCSYLCFTLQLDTNLALVLLHDFLFGKGIKCGGPLKYSVLRHKEHLKRSLKAIGQEETNQQCKPA